MSYKNSGVDTDAADQWTDRLSRLVSLHSTTELKKNLVSGIGDYASVYALNEENWVACSTDGVGTKLLWTQEGLGKPEDLAMDLLAMNANDLLCVGAKPTLFLDYLAIGSKKLLEPGQSVDRLIQGLAKHCAESGQLLVGGETAQMPDLYEDNAFDVAGFSVGFMKPEDRLGTSKIHEGAEIWGWASRGPHSNGYSWLRQLFNGTNDASFIESELMLPTQLYVRPFDLLKTELSKIQAQKSLLAAFHVTGSGLLNLLRDSRLNLGFDFSHWPEEDPVWVQAVRERSGASEKELFTTFNMGFGFLCIFSSEIGEKQRTLLASLGLQFLGQVVRDKGVKIRGLTLF